ncbi:uncharacterized protein LOC102450762 [Pelodiscus sinensis]|uniref:uncharacterized protein LOC102450762 n=1 Tax=Pelodiscus sinensis TaxID=13735 RepID=UPI003F6CAC38
MEVRVQRIPLCICDPCEEMSKFQWLKWSCDCTASSTHGPRSSTSTILQAGACLMCRANLLSRTVVNVRSPDQAKTSPESNEKPMRCLFFQLPRA